MRLRPLALLAALLAAPALAQQPPTTARAPGSAAGASVNGIVYDSLAGAPLVGAVVQLVPVGTTAGTPRAAVTDALGRYALDGVPTGRYALGFLHPMLDSLGLEPPTRDVYVLDARPMRADLAIPSPARLHAAICGARGATPAGGAVVVGAVREAREAAAVPEATVTAEWIEYTIGRDGMGRRLARRSATTTATGWFALCDVPRGGSVVLLARHDADSTDRIEVDVPAGGFARRELYVGRARSVTAAARGDTIARVVRAGEGRLRGLVVTALGEQPLAGARVHLLDGPETRANERGEWVLDGVPTGTRMLEVRAVGHVPVRRAVDVVAGAPPVRVELSSVRAMLDTVRIRAGRINDPLRAGFTERRRTQPGRFYTSAEIARQQPVVTSDLFRSVLGFEVAGARGSANVPLVMRGLYGACTPAVYIDGQLMLGNGGRVSTLDDSGQVVLGGAERGVTTDDLDEMIQPGEIAAMELYSGTSIPPQFQPGMLGCGSIVIWRK